MFAPAGTTYTPWNGSSTVAALLAANPGWSLQGTVVGFTTPSAGVFTGNTLSLNGIAGGANYDGVVIGWNGTYASFDAALSGGGAVGVSSKFTSGTGNPNTT